MLATGVDAARQVVGLQLQGWLKCKAGFGREYFLFCADFPRLTLGLQFGSLENLPLRCMTSLPGVRSPNDSPSPYVRSARTERLNAPNANCGRVSLCDHLIVAGRQKFQSQRMKAASYVGRIRIGAADDSIRPGSLASVSGDARERRMSRTAARH
ncbi:hypothetical protein X767_31395 [Mesorhizobium sp. LSJC264A00]|nr:hypothetical protein X767_31395 [Mesorhizobium sp. LSJC264A00]